MGNKPKHLESHSPQQPKVSEGAGQRANPWADLVIAILSVNNYPLTKTFELVDSLETSGLFDLRNLARWSSLEIARRLGAAGYDRGNVMTTIFSDRLSSLGALADELIVHEQILSEGTREQVGNLLKRVKGVGPTVLKNFIDLRG